jgi:hypothetical protein
MSRNGWEQAVVFFLDDGIAFTRTLLESWTVEYCDMPAAILDQPRILQMAGSLGDTLATYAKHVSDKLLRHHQFFGMQSIKAQKKPSTKLLIQ